MSQNDVTLPAQGDHFPVTLPVEAIRAYSMGRLPLAPAFLGSVERAQETEPDDGRRVRVAEVKIDGVWVPL